MLQLCLVKSILIESYRVQCNTNPTYCQKYKPSTSSMSSACFWGRGYQAANWQEFLPPKISLQGAEPENCIHNYTRFSKKHILSLLGGFCTLTYSLSCGLQGIVDIASKLVISTLLQIMPVNNHFVVHALCHHVYKIENFDTAFCWLPSLTTTFFNRVLFCASSKHCLIWNKFQNNHASDKLITWRRNFHLRCCCALWTDVPTTFFVHTTFFCVGACSCLLVRVDIAKIVYLVGYGSFYWMLASYQIIYVKLFLKL